MHIPNPNISQYYSRAANAKLVRPIHVILIIAGGRSLRPCCPTTTAAALPLITAVCHLSFIPQSDLLHFGLEVTLQSIRAPEN